MNPLDLKGKKFAVVSLGCDKNRVDTERMIGKLSDVISLTSDPADAEIIIINTCAFIESARKESIDTIIEFDAYRDFGKLEKLVVAGCLSQKYADELFTDLTEADIIIGIHDYDLLPDAICESYSEDKHVNYVGKGLEESCGKRVVSTPLHYAYLKIADGCNNRCAYCLIPYIRGNYRSVKIEELVAEAESLGDVAEIILVAQDITRYGVDIYKKPSLVTLIRKLSELENIERIRLLYCYPDMISDELIAEIRDNDKVVKYIDIPLQHADDNVLKSMNRRGSRAEYLALISKLKREIPQIAIRSTFIAGFPGESEEAFENLMSFLTEAQLFNAGFFAYSREEGTPAYSFENQVPEGEKEKRVRKLYSLQRKISKNNLARFKGQVIDVIFDEIAFDKGMFAGRAYFSAPDIDGRVYFTSEETVNQGETYKVKIERTDAYDLYGSVNK